MGTKYFTYNERLREINTLKLLQCVYEGIQIKAFPILQYMQITIIMINNK